MCNLADCIKIAVDFISPENVDRCDELTREFREQNQSAAWKDDVLQLKMTMFHAWNSITNYLALKDAQSQNEPVEVAEESASLAANTSDDVVP